MVAGYIGLSRLNDELCSLLVVRRTLSPNGHREAVLYQRNCGATTDFATNLSVVSAGARIANARGNVLVADSYDGQAPLDSGSVIHLSVKWLGDDSLLVQYDRRARLFRQELRVRGVSVRYDTIPL